MVYNLFVIASAFLLYGYYQNKYRDDRYINAIFILMWIIFSIEFYTTKDYPVYYKGFYNCGNNENWEPVYKFLVEAFQPVGFIVFNAVVAAFEIFTLCFFFKKVVPPKYRWLSLTILMLDTGNLFLFMNLKRQFFAMMVAIWIVYFLLYSQHKYRYLFSIFAFLGAINIHSSAYIAIGYFLLPFIKVRLSKVAILSILLVYIASYTFRLSSFSDQLFLLLSSTGSNADYYDVYILQQEDYEGTSSGMGNFVLLYNLSMFLLLLFLNKKFTEQQYKLVLCSILSFVLMNILKGNFFRLYFYYSIFNIFNISVLLMILFKQKSTLIWIYLICLAFALPIKSYYNAFFGEKISYMTIKYKHYYTIFHTNPDKRDYLF